MNEICENLCTAAKCQELEQRIVELEEIVEQLKAINISGTIINDDLQITVANAFNSDTDTIDMSTYALDRVLDDHIDTAINENNVLAHTYTPNVQVNLDLTEIANFFNLDVVVRVDDEEAVDNVVWTKTAVNFESVFVDIAQQNEQYELYVEVTINNESLSDTVLFEVDAGSNGNIAIDGSVANKELFLTVATDQATDTATISLPFVFQEDFDEHLDLAINFAHKFRPTINLNIFENSDSYTFSVTWTELISGITVSSSDSFTLDMSQIQECCDDLSSLIRQENDQNQALLEALSSLIELRTGQIEALLQTTFPADTYDITCTSEGLGDKATSPFKIKTVTTNQNSNTVGGIAGIGTALNNLSEAISRIESTLCLQSIPEFEFLTAVGNNCSSSSSIEYFLDNSLNLSWMRTLVDTAKGENPNIDPNENNLVISNNFWVYLTYQLSLINEQQRLLIDPICEPLTEVVPVNVSYAVDKTTKGRHLILHFVDLDNYPKRSSSGSLRPVQIPRPIANENLDWATFFENMRWEQGNLYCQLILKDSNNNKFSPPISGFFANQQAADDYFDSVLPITELSELQRKYHPTNNAQTNFTVKTTRPYRAFVIDLDNEGNPVCELKIVPITQ